MGTTQRLNVRQLFMRVIVPATWFAGYAVVGKDNEPSVSCTFSHVGGGADYVVASVAGDKRNL